MATSEAQEIKKQETLVRFSIISYKTRLRVVSNYIVMCLKDCNSRPISGPRHNVSILFLISFSYFHKK